MLHLILQIVNFFKSIENKTPAPKPEPIKPTPETKKEEPVVVKKRKPLTVEDWVTSSGRYPDRKKSPSLTQEVLAEAALTISAVNGLLDDIGYDEPVSISSGFRPPEVNANVKGAAKKSAHMTGLAVDIFQPKPENKLGKLVRSLQADKGKDGVLGKRGLMMEALEATVGTNSLWSHFDRVVRSDRPSREFKP